MISSTLDSERSSKRFEDEESILGVKESDEDGLDDNNQDKEMISVGWMFYHINLYSCRLE